MKLFTLKCAACGLDLGKVQRHQSDHVYELHMPRCTATVAQYDQALARVKHALITGDTSELRCSTS